MTTQAQLRREHPDYLRGWRAAGNSRSTDVLGRADDRNEPSGWYDGYLDHAAGRPLGHLVTCTDRDRHELCWGCQWYALCENEATTTEPHPVLGDVPICDRCQAKAHRLRDA